eukprot:1544942-Amphidinium_carterae.1
MSRQRFGRVLDRIEVQEHEQTDRSAFELCPPASVVHANLHQPFQGHVLDGKSSGSCARGRNVDKAFSPLDRSFRASPPSLPSKSNKRVTLLACASAEKRSLAKAAKREDVALQNLIAELAAAE